MKSGCFHGFANSDHWPRAREYSSFAAQEKCPSTSGILEVVPVR